MQLKILLTNIAKGLFFTLFFTLFNNSNIFAKDLLTESMIIESAQKHHPKIYINEEKIRLAEAKLKEALGAFDSKIEAKYNQFTDGYYRDRGYVESKIIKPSPIANSKFYIGYNQSINGQYPELNSYFNTKNDGRTIFGFELSLLRGFLINEQATLTKISNIDIDTAKYSQSLMKSQIIADARKSYWKLFYSKKVLDLYRDMLNIAVKRDVSLRLQVKKGDKPPILIDENARTILKRQSAVESAKRELFDSATNLSMYFRKEDGEMFEVEKIMSLNLDSGDFNLLNPTKTEFELDKNSAKQNRFDIKIAKNLLNQANIKIKLAKNQFLPIVDIGFESTKDYGTNYNVGAIDKNNTANKVKLNIAIPLEMNKQIGGIGKTNADLKIANKNLALLQDSITNEITFVYNKINEVEVLLKNSLAEIEIAKKLLNAENIKFNNGDSDFFMLNAREQDLLNAIEYSYKTKLTMVALIIEYNFMTKDTTDRR